MVSNRFTDAPKFAHLFDRQYIQQMTSHALDMDGRGTFQSGKAGVGENGELSPAIILADLPTDPTTFLQPGCRM